MIPKRSFISKILVLLLSPTIFCGRSLVGFGLGALRESSESDHLPSQIRDLPRAEYYVVYYGRSDTVRAKSIFVHQIAPLTYAKKYDQMRRECVDSLWLPAIGESVILTRNDGVAIECKFVGFEQGEAYVTGIAGRVDTVIADFSHIQSTEDRQGRSLSQGDASNFFKTKIPPSMYEIIVATEAGKKSIPLSEVQKIHCVPAWDSRNAKWIGLGAGLLVDAIIVYVIIDAMRRTRLPRGHLPLASCRAARPSAGSEHSWNQRDRLWA